VKLKKKNPIIRYVTIQNYTYLSCEIFIITERVNGRTFGRLLGLALLLLVRGIAQHHLLPLPSLSVHTAREEAVVRAFSSNLKGLSHEIDVAFDDMYG
jgi:hypothetical protein